MAIYHLSVKVVSRSKGQSAVASAAYRSGDALTDEREGRTHDYTRRRGVEASFIVAPAGCEWAHDRAALWNAAEATEKRKNSTVAREYELALPAELDGQEREVLARQFAAAVVERFGVAADIAIHAPGREGDQRNHHAHILTTTRVVEPDGLGEKTRVLDAAKTGSAEIESLRELWAMQCNEALERAGQTARVDHRSYERQGAEVVPGVHLGPHSTAVERKAAHQAEQEGREYEPRTYRAKANADAAEKNGIAKALRQIIESAEQAIAKVQQAAEDLMDWFAELADEVGRDAIERKEQERQERQRAIMERLAREQREAQERAEQESARQKLIDEGFTGGRKGQGGRRR